MSSLSNVMAALLVARSFDTPEPFGTFGLVMVIYQLMVGLLRALVGEPFLSLYSAADLGERTRVMREGIAFNIAAALLGSIVIAGAGVLTGGMTGRALVSLSVVLPFLLLQDGYRYYSIVDRAGIALIIDTVWLIGVPIGFAFLPDQAGVEWYTLTWGIAGAVSTALAFFLVPRLIVPQSPWRWIRKNIVACRNALGEYLTVGVTHHLSMLLLGPVSGLTAVSAVRASQVFYGPHVTLHGGIYLAVVPEGVRLRRKPSKMIRLLSASSLLLALFALLWMLMGMAMPTAWGEAILGPNWDGARRLMVPFGIGMIATGLSTGGRFGLRSLGDLRRSFITRLYITPWQLCLPLAGAFGWGAYGFSVGFAIGRIATAVLWWNAFRVSLTEHRGQIDSDGRTARSEPATSGLAQPAQATNG